MFCFIDGGPIDNKFKHCPYCGCVIEVEHFPDETDDEEVSELIEGQGYSV